MKCPYDIPLKPIYCRLAESWIVEDVNGYVVFADLNISEAKANYIVQAINSHEKLVKHVEALKSVCEKYIPADKMDEANDEVILLSVGITEEIGRKLLSKQALKGSEK